MNIHVDLNLRLPGGAHIELTQKQFDDVTSFIKKMFAGGEGVEKRPRKKYRARAPHRWSRYTPQEDEEIASIVAHTIPRSEARKIAIKSVAKKLGRSKASIKTRVYSMENEHDEEVAEERRQEALASQSI